MRSGGINLCFDFGTDVSVTYEFGFWISDIGYQILDFEMFYNKNLVFTV